MKWTRYEILLPLRYNDGRTVEAAKFLRTHVDLIENFGADTIDVVAALGSWKYGGVVYEDALIRMTIDVQGSFEADDFFREYKEVLKARFEQIDIWISSHEIHIL
jgi:hypothetical protein